MRPGLNKFGAGFSAVLICLTAGSSLAGPVTNVPQPLTFDEVRVGGELRARLERNFTRLHEDPYQSEMVLVKSRDEFIHVRREWSPGDVLEYVFDFNLTTKPVHNSHSLAGYQIYQDGPLLLAGQRDPQPVAAGTVPAIQVPDGKLQAAGPGRFRAGTLELAPVYHLMNPAYDDSKTSWRQLLFPASPSR
jgi:hypothetical protein